MTIADEKKNTPLPSRDQALNNIADAVLYGNLGLFIGAGLPMAIMNNASETTALSWNQLLAKCFKDFKIPQKKVTQKGSSYPEIATNLCKLIAVKRKISYEEAVIQLKQKIANFTSLYPSQQRRNEYKKYFEVLDPKWIITTNYDTVIESILTGRSITLPVKDPLVAPRNLVPVFHLHGVRTNPSSIIITQQDYISLFRPNQYRQHKLPLILKESFTLLIGYNLGDFNVQTAVDWTTSVFTDQPKLNPNGMVQLLFKQQNAKKEPYLENGILIIEFNSLPKILSEICAAATTRKTEASISERKLRNIEKHYLNPSEAIVIKFAEDERERKKSLNTLRQSDHRIINGFLELLSRSFEHMWKKSRINGGFKWYDKNLKLQLDILEFIDINSAPPALIEMLIYNLRRIGYFLGDGRGMGNEAFKTWKDRRSKIHLQTLIELTNICVVHSYTKLHQLLTEEYE